MKGKGYDIEWFFCPDKRMTLVIPMIIPISFNMYQILNENYYNEEK